MKALATIALLVALPVTAFAGDGGLNLSWNKCDTSPASLDRSDACDGNTGLNPVFTGSFRPTFSVQQFDGVEAVLDIVWGGTSEPDFWSSSACPALQVIFKNPVPSSPCAPNLFDPNASGGGYRDDIVTPNHHRWTLDWMTGASTPPSVTPGNLYAAFAFTVFVSNPPSCAGCSVPACLTFTQLSVYDRIPDLHVAGVLTDVDVRNAITWQGGAVGGGCPGATPSVDHTWGAVKALYR
jgi:hypothetical protein